MTAHDPWEVAMALHAKAMAPSDVTELRQRVDEAVSAMDATGNVYGQVGLLGAAAVSR